jgi:hypothetical protein
MLICRRGIILFVFKCFSPPLTKVSSIFFLLDWWCFLKCQIVMSGDWFHNRLQHFFAISQPLARCPWVGVAFLESIGQLWMIDALIWVMGDESLSIHSHNACVSYPSDMVWFLVHWESLQNWFKVWLNVKDTDSSLFQGFCLGPDRHYWRPKMVDVLGLHVPSHQLRMKISTTGDLSSHNTWCNCIALDKHGQS